MINKGDVLENPLTGEVLVFYETAAETRGERVVYETTVRPGGVAPAHVHPHQTKRLEVLSGVLAVEVDEVCEELGPGDALTIEPRTAHALWNRHDEDARFVAEVRPALALESLLEAAYASSPGAGPDVRARGARPPADERSHRLSGRHG
jgi:quercetin dioxygenase-like cupin family protein